eukprot:gene11765-24665_t
MSSSVSTSRCSMGSMSMSMSMSSSGGGVSEIEVTPTSSSVVSMNTINAKSSQTQTQTPKPMARFVRDVSLPDNTRVAPGSRVTKSWILRNDGTIPWPQGTTLVHVSGDSISPDVSTPVSSAVVGEEVTISVNLELPVQPGRYISYWRLQAPPPSSSTGKCAASNGMFGHRLWADVCVVDSNMNDQLQYQLQYQYQTQLPIEDDNSDNNDVFSRLGSSLMSAASESSLRTSRNKEEIPVVKNGLSEQWVDVSQLISETNMYITSSPTSSSSSSALAVSTGHATSAALYTEGEELWTRELRLLAEMGFTDKDTLVPLLAANFETPSPIDDKIPVNADSLARCLNELLLSA